MTGEGAWVVRRLAQLSVLQVLAGVEMIRLNQTDMNEKQAYVVGICLVVWSRPVFVSQWGKSTQLFYVLKRFMEAALCASPDTDSSSPTHPISRCGHSEKNVWGGGESTSQCRFKGKTAKSLCSPHPHNRRATTGRNGGGGGHGSVT